MTTVTEAAKRLGIDLHPLEEAKLATLKDDTLLAQQLARRLVAAAKEIAPGATWSTEALIEVLEAAAHGRIGDTDRIVEGRHLRKRVRELCGVAERYEEPFALVVLKLVREPREGLYASMARPIAARLRPADMLTVYKRRLALLLPNLSKAGIPALEERVRGIADTSAGAGVVEAIASAAFPSAGLDDSQSILDWLEDQLRVDG